MIAFTQLLDVRGGMVTAANGAWISRSLQRAFSCRWSCVEAIHICQQHQQVCLKLHSKQGCQAIIVSEGTCSTLQDSKHQYLEVRLWILSELVSVYELLRACLSGHTGPAGD